MVDWALKITYLSICGLFAGRLPCESDTPLLGGRFESFRQRARTGLTAVINGLCLCGDLLPSALSEVDSVCVVTCCLQRLVRYVDSVCAVTCCLQR